MHVLSAAASAVLRPIQSLFPSLIDRRRSASVSADGVVWRSTDGLLYKRTGDASVDGEAHFQRLLAELGYPVPELVETGQTDGVHYFVERSVGSASLHELALSETGHVGQDVIEQAVEISTRLLKAQARNPLPGGPAQLQEWFERAGFAGNVFSENPDLDTPRVHQAVARALNRLDEVPMCRSHLDYGLPNAFPSGVIDWQHHGIAPLGYDVYPMLEIAAFKGGNKGYQFTPEQCAHYLTALNDASTRLTGGPLGGYQGEFLLVKCFFFLALMRPTDPAKQHEKHVKWRYRRTLLKMGLEQYESSGAIHTGTFPTLATFTERLAQPAAGHS